MKYPHIEPKLLALCMAPIKKMGPYDYASRLEVLDREISRLEEILARDEKPVEFLSSTLAVKVGEMSRERSRLAREYFEGYPSVATEEPA